MHREELIENLSWALGDDARHIVQYHCPVEVPHFGECGTFEFRGYQKEIMLMQERIGVVCIGRQLGKSFALAFLALLRALNKGRQVTVFGATEYHSRKLLEYIERFADEVGLSYKKTKQIVKIEEGGQIVARGGSVRSARGDTGDVVVDEFAFLTNPAEFFEAVKPIISASPNYIMRLSSTPNGHNYFETLFNRYPHVFCPRSRAHHYFGVQIYSEKTGELLTPEEAEAESVDRVKYRQNFECDFDSQVSECVFSADEVDKMAQTGDFITSTSTLPPVSVDFLGVDVGRSGHSTVCWGCTTGLKAVRCLVLEKLPIDEQANKILRFFKLDTAKVAIDTNGLGIGLYDILRRALGKRILGVNAAKRVQVSGQAQSLGMAVASSWRKYRDLLSIPPLGDSLRQLTAPYILGNKIVTPTIDSSHSDVFWSFVFCLYLRMLRDKVIR